MAQGQAKQYLHVHDRSLLDWSVAALLAWPELRGCVVALPQGDLELKHEGSLRDGRVMLCVGGASRAESVMAGLEALPANDEDWVLVHDAARPCLSQVDLQRLIEAVTQSGVGGLLALPVTDTLKQSNGDRHVLSTIDRECIWRAQTPQMFRVGQLRDALLAAHEQGIPVTDEASALEAAGVAVQLVPGSIGNLKVTYASDVPLAAFWLEQLHSQDDDMTTRAT